MIFTQLNHETNYICFFSQLAKMLLYEKMNDKSGKPEPATP